jgi:hypothetical protein
MGGADTGAALGTAAGLSTAAIFATGSLDAGTVCESLAVVDALAICTCGAVWSASCDRVAFEAVIAAERVGGAATTARVVVARLDPRVATARDAGVGFRATELPA